jgi:hypothetical protein
MRWFYCDSELRDGEFEKCDDDDYMTNNENDNEGEVTAPYEEVREWVSINTIHDNIVNVLISGW